MMRPYFVYHRLAGATRKFYSEECRILHSRGRSPLEISQYLGVPFDDVLDVLEIVTQSEPTALLSEFNDIP